MKLAFALANAGGLFDRLIGWWTDGKYCHVEIWFDLTDAQGPKQALCFSSIQGTGTRFARRDLGSPQSWFVVPLGVTQAQEITVHNLAQALAGRRYDWLDIVAFLIPPLDRSRARVVGQPKRFICSAVCTYLCQQVGLFEGNPPGETSPDLLADLAVVHAGMS